MLNLQKYNFFIIIIKLVKQLLQEQIVQKVS